tara:strand:- start:4 stop:309 length:306 start_codon:yes stop_codon:yes gene_type:complete
LGLINELYFEFRISDRISNKGQGQFHTLGIRRLNESLAGHFAVVAEVGSSPVVAVDSSLVVAVDSNLAVAVDSNLAVAVVAVVAVIVVVAVVAGQALVVVG